ncbi:MAG: hypothetical protein AB1705_14855, partial [Verrucomicrobiota bacterium]
TTPVAAPATAPINPVAPPPPPPPPGATPGASPTTLTVNAPVAVNPAAGDPLIHFRFDPEGRRVDDFTALQAACDGYSRLMGSVAGPEDKPLPPLTADMSGLIARGLVKAIPTAPDGKRYIFDTETRKVKIQ